MSALRVHAVIPLKALARGKSRLAGALADGAREQLIRTMLEQVVAAVAEAPGIAQVSVLTPDPAVVPRGAGHLAESGEGLNAALACAADALRRGPAGVMLIVAADLPFLTAEDIGALVEATHSGALVAAPDWRHAGTNALALPLSRSVSLRFGPGSLAAHEAAARAAELPWSVVHRTGLAFDVDEPAQLASLVRACTERYAFLSPGAPRSYHSSE